MRPPCALITLLAAAACAAAPAVAAGAVEEIDLDAPLRAAPALTSSDVIWALARADRGFDVLASPGARAEPRTLASFPLLAGAPKQPRTLARLDVRAVPEQLLVAQVVGARTAYQEVEPPWGPSAVELQTDDATRDVLRCPRASALPPAALGATFVVHRACVGDRRHRPAIGEVFIDGRFVGEGSLVAAAGRYAAWLEADGRVAVHDTATASLVHRVPGGEQLALDDDGTVITASPPVPRAGFETTISRTPLDGPTETVIVESDVVRGLVVRHGLIAYTVEQDDRHLVVAILPDGRRREVAWTATGAKGVATDGARVAFDGSVPACRLSRVAISDLQGPLSDQASGRCPVNGPYYGRLTATRTELRVRLSVKTEHVGEGVEGTIRLLRDGRVLARGGFDDLFGRHEVTVPLTAAGRRVAARGRVFRGELEIVRTDGPLPVRRVREKGVEIVG